VITSKRRALVAVLSLISTTLLSKEVVPRHWVPKGTLLTIRVASPERFASELAALRPEGRGPNLYQFVAGFLGLSSLEGVAEDRAWYAFWVEGKLTFN
jgi:hypothetical protein